MGLIFDMCDIKGDNQINKRELIKACKSNKAIADFFKLPTAIRQEDGRNQFESIFQAIDSDDNRELSWEEFKIFFGKARKSMETSGSAEKSKPALPIAEA